MFFLRLKQIWVAGPNCAISVDVLLGLRHFVFDFPYYYETKFVRSALEWLIFFPVHLVREQ